MKNVTPVSDQENDVDGPARDEQTPALRRAGPLQLGTDPAWDFARRLLKVGRANARAMAEEIERLRAEYLGDGRNGPRNHHALNVKSRSAQIVPNDSKGFQAKLREELGLHHEQAKRLQEAAAYEMRIEAFALAQPGETITWIGDEDQPCSMRATVELIEAACVQLEGLRLPGGPRPARAWAGLIGGATTAGKERAPVDHNRNLERAMKALANSLEVWATLKPLERARLEAAWTEMLEAGIVPQSFIEAVLARFGSASRR